jgi:hypothetical protein
MISSSSKLKSLNEIKHRLHEVLLSSYGGIAALMSGLLSLVDSLIESVHDVVLAVIAGVLFDDLEKLLILSFQDVDLNIEIAEFFLLLVSGLLS